ncbi:hypothetical protein [Alloyangia pacifica]|nr:hypothetical protein [Alloyangia pacifica]
MTDLLTAFVIICVPIRVAHMLIGLPAARARRRRIQQFYQPN